MPSESAPAPTALPRPRDAAPRPRRLSRWLLGAVVALLVLIGGVLGLFAWFVALQNRNVSSGVAVGQHAPDFSLPDQSGHLQSLRQLSGPRGLLLVFVRSADW